MVGLVEVRQGLLNKDGKADGGHVEDIQKLAYLVEIIVHKHDLFVLDLMLQLYP